ncbi:MAG: hypothetical protein ABF303_03980 [Desulfobacterales bacterium]
MAAKKKAEKEKPLEKMTAKEMREIAKAISGITGVHGMARWASPCHWRSGY